MIQNGPTVFTDFKSELKLKTLACNSIKQLFSDGFFFVKVPASNKNISTSIEQAQVGDVCE